jgi:hypothetical protein
MITLKVWPTERELMLSLQEFVAAVEVERSNDLMQMLKTATHGVTISISKVRKNHTRSQENYYRKWCNQFAKHCGMTPDEMHNELLCICYGSEEIETKFGVMRRPLHRSSGADTREYSELIDVLINVAAEMGFAVPPPPSEEDYA